MSRLVLDAVVDPPVGRGFYQATLDSLGDSLAVLNHKGKIVAVNRAWTRFAEANGGSGVGVGANYLQVCDRSAVDDPSAGRVASALRELLVGGLREFVYVYPCHAPGVERWFSMRVAPLEGSTPRRLVVSHHEMTERHQAQARSHEQVGLLDAIDAAIISIDLNSDITSWNRGAEELNGWSEAEALGQPVAIVSGGTSLDADVVKATLKDHSQRDLDTDLGIAALEQAIGDREQAIGDREQTKLDETQAQLDREVAEGPPGGSAGASQRRRQAENRRAQTRLAWSQNQRDDAQRARDQHQALLDHQQAELDDPQLADIGTPAAADAERAVELSARADAMEQRATEANTRAVEARRRGETAVQHPAKAASRP